MGGDATQLYIPIVTVIGMMTGLVVIIWFAATKSTQIEGMEERLSEQEKLLRDVPTRAEYNTLIGSMNEIKDAIKDLRKELANR